MANTTVAFLCYDRHDDRDRSVSSFREALTEALVSKGAGPVEIFQDRVNIRWGENWRDRIRGALDETPLLVPIVTPNFLQSDECRDELEYFLEGEDRRRRWDLILPVYFYPVRKIDDREPIAGDYLIAELRRRQWQDWIDLRAEAPDSPRRIAYLGRRPSIHHNRIHDGNQEGIYIGEGASGLIEDNEIVKNRFAGIAIRADANPKVRRNRIHSGVREGIYVGDHGRGLIDGNIVRENAVSGIHIERGGDPIVGVTNRLYSNGPGGGVNFRNMNT